MDIKAESVAHRDFQFRGCSPKKLEISSINFLKTIVNDQHCFLYCLKRGVKNRIFQNFQGVQAHPKK